MFNKKKVGEKMANNNYKSNGSVSDYGIGDDDEVEGIFTRLDIVNKKLYIVKQGYDIELIISLEIFQQKMDINDI